MRLRDDAIVFTSTRLLGTRDAAVYRAALLRAKSGIPCRKPRLLLAKGLLAPRMPQNPSKTMKENRFQANDSLIDERRRRERLSQRTHNPAILADMVVGSVWSTLSGGVISQDWVQYEVWLTKCLRLAVRGDPKSVEVFHCRIWGSCGRMIGDDSVPANTYGRHGDHAKASTTDSPTA